MSNLTFILISFIYYLFIFHKFSNLLLFIEVNWFCGYTKLVNFVIIFFHLYIDFISCLIAWAILVWSQKF
jgi:hypothetical protein